MNCFASLIFALFISCISFALPTWADPQADRPTVLITGSNRGLGLEFARQYAAKGWNVIATCRKPDEAPGLQALAAKHDQVVIEKIDVTLDEDVNAVASKYKDQPIDVLLNNAGIYGTLEKQTLGSFDFEELQRVLDVNTIGGLRVASGFLPHVLASDQKRIVSLGGGMGTQTIGSMFPGHYFMKMSKAAHLSAMGTLQAEVRDQGAIITVISPGRVDTQLMQDSGWTGPSISAEESAGHVIERIELLDPSVGGKLIMYNGTVVPW